MNEPEVRAWIITMLIVMGVTGTLTLAAGIRRAVREPIFTCRNCRRVIGPLHASDRRTKAEVRRDHEKRCFS